MGLVDYASSEEDDEQDEQEEQAASMAISTATLKRKRDVQDESEHARKKEVSPSLLPPLPPRFRDLYATATKLSTRDDPSLHGGRKRATPHIQGNWPTHLYIEWFPSSTEYSRLSKLISALKTVTTVLPLPGDITPATIHSFLTSDLGVPLPLHISLSRSLGLSTEQKDAFLSSLQNSIKSSQIRPFDVSFTGINWVPNFEKTRWFLVLHVQRPAEDELNKLLYVCNSVAGEYDQPLLYSETRSSKSHLTAGNTLGNVYNSGEKDPEREFAHSGSRGKRRDCWEDMDDGVSDAFHISIAWTLEKPCVEVIERTRRLQESSDFEDMRTGIRVRTEEVKAKIGNVVTSIGLPSLRANVKGGLFGM